MAAERVPTGEDDGLPIAEVGSWAEDKYRLVSLYDKLFSTGMKRKWDARVYIDLYAGPGFARVEGSQRILWGSPLLALGVPDPFDKYILCESDSILLDALRRRVARLFPRQDVAYVQGDCNERVQEIHSLIPPYSPERRVLTFCFADPFDISIKFSTIRRFCSPFLMDFLFLLALHMDANRNISYYTNPASTKIAEFLGLADWRDRWQTVQMQAISFPRFLAEQFSSQMQSLGYLPMPFEKMKLIRSDIKNLPLYHLALFSRHPRAYQYWDEVLTYSTDQRHLGFEQ